MKRLLPLLIVFLLLSGCSASHAPRAKDHLWQLVTVQDAAGSIIACAPGASAMPDDARPILLTCQLQDGQITLASDSGTIHSGTYRVSSTTRDARQLAVSLGHENGIGTLAYTVVNGGSPIPTLLISISGYALTFCCTPTD